MPHTISGASLQPIYERLNTAPRYHPIEAETFADWSMEAGDIVTITRDGQSYQSPVQASVVKWRKGQQVSVSSGGNESRNAVSKVSQNKYNGGIGGGSGLRNSQYNIWRFESQYNELAAGLVITASGLYTYANNQYTAMSSGLTQTASSISAFVNSRYDQMTAGLVLTSSSFTAYVNSKYDQMTAGLEITSSSLSAYVNNKYTQMTAGLNLTSSSLSAYVRSNYEQMQSGLALTSSSAAIYTNGRTSRAYIMTRINATGESEALINANVVSIQGTTTINDIMTIADGRVYIKSPLRVEGDAMLGSLTLRSGASSDTITQMDLAGMIKKATVSGNVLTLTPVHGDPITFSKATSLSGSWSGGILTILASPQNVSATVSVAIKGSNASNNPYSVSAVSTNKKLGTATIIAQATGSSLFNGTATITGTAQLNCTQNWNAGYDACGATAFVSGPMTITSNNTYIFKGMYADKNGGDDQESGNILTVTVAVPTSATINVTDLSTQGSTWTPTGNSIGTISKGSIAAPGYITMKINNSTYYISIMP